MSLAFPKRCGSHGYRLHRSDSDRHSDSAVSTPASTLTSFSTQSESAQSQYGTIPRRSSDRAMPTLDEENEHQDGAQSSTTPLPGRPSESFLGSSPPRRASSVSNSYTSNGHTILVERTPLLQQQHRAARHIPSNDPTSSGLESPTYSLATGLAQRTRPQASLDDIREQLGTIKGVVDDLRTTIETQRLETFAKKAELYRLQNESILPEKQQCNLGSESERFTPRTKLLMLLSLTVLVVALYQYWLWCVGPEMSYIRERRRAQFLE